MNIKIGSSNQTNIMKRFFTQTKFIFMALMAFGLVQASAQVNLTVEGLGTFEASLAQFGQNDPCTLGDIEAPLRLANDGTPNSLACAAFNDQSIRGKIAVVSRGDCAFEVKALNCEANGAVAVVICNTEPGIRPMGDDTGTSSLPTILVGAENCFNLLAELAGGNEVNGTISAQDVNLSSAVTVAWGNQPGQGEFEAGLGDWTAQNCTTDNSGDVVEVLTWEWTNNPVEEWFGSQMISYSRCNGAIGYDATAWNIANGDLSNPNNYPDHHCELVSPVIDLSNAGPVSLQFWQVLFTLNGNDNPGLSVGRFFVSTDGGVTYDEDNPIYVETNNILTADQTNWANGELRRYFLPELAGESQVRLRFEFHGDFYAWYIDDVYFIETPNNSLTLNEDVFGAAPSALTPQNLVDPILGIAEVANTGLLAQPNTRIDIEYQGPVSGSTSVDLMTLESDSVAFDCATDFFTPTEVGIYTATMTADSDSTDFDYSDNSVSFNFEVTDSLWAKDAGEVNGSVRPADAPDFIWGAVYTVNENYSGTDAIHAVEFGFELSDSIDGSDQFLTWSLLEWADGNDDGTAQASERINITGGFVQFTYRTNGDGDMNLYNFADLGIDPVTLEAGKTYILAVTWANPDRDLSLLGYNGLDYLGMRVAYDECTPVSRYNDVIGVGSADINGDWSTGGWNGGISPAMRLITQPVTVSNEEITAEYSLSLYPNPAQDLVNIEIDFEERVDNLEVSITDITGKVMEVRNISNVMSTNTQFDVRSYSTGVYFAKIRTNEGIATQRFVVNR
jgi:hypothetical protein